MIGWDDCVKGFTGGETRHGQLIKKEAAMEDTLIEKNWGQQVTHHQHKQQQIKPTTEKTNAPERDSKRATKNQSLNWNQQPRK